MTNETRDPGTADQTRDSHCRWRSMGGQIQRYGRGHIHSWSGKIGDRRDPKGYKGARAEARRHAKEHGGGRDDVGEYVGGGEAEVAFYHEH